MPPASLRPSAETARVRRSVNWRVLRVSVAVVVTFLAISYFLRQRSAQQSTQALWDLAKQYAEEEKYDLAAKHLYQYLQIRPQDVSAKLRLAEVFDKSQSLTQPLRAVELYQEVLGLAAPEQQRDIRTRLAELYLRIGKYISAEEATRAVLKETPKDAHLNGLLAESLFGQYRQGILKGKPSSVGDAFHQAVKLAPQDGKLVVALACLYRDDPNVLPEQNQQVPLAERVQFADRLVDDLVAQAGESPTAYITRYDYRLRYHLPGSDEDLKAAKRLGPENLEVVIRSANESQRTAAAALAQGEAGKAEAQTLLQAAQTDYEKAIELAPKDSRAYIGLGQVLIAEKKVDEALKLWYQGLEQAPQAGWTLNVMVADTLISLKRLDEADKHLEILSQYLERERLASGRLPSEKLALAREYQFTRAKWLALKGDLNQAISLAQEATHGPSATPADHAFTVASWSLLGSLRQSLHRYDEAAAAWEEAAGLQPMAAAYCLLAAESWSSAQRPEMALRWFRQALTREESADTRLALTAAQLQLAMLSPAGSRDWKSVQQALADTKTAHAKTPLRQPWRLALIEAEILVSQATTESRAQSIKQATTLLELAEKTYPSERGFLPLLAAVYEHLEQVDAAQRVVDRLEAAGEEGDNVDLLRIRLAGAHGDFAKAREVLARHIKEGTAPDRVWARAQIELNLREGNWIDAAKQLIAISDLDANDLDLVIQVTELSVEHPSDATEACLEKLRQLEGADGRISQYCQIRFLLAQAKSSDDAKFRRVEDLVAKLRSDFPDWSTRYLIEGRLEEVRGNRDAAVVAYKEAIRLGEPRAEVYQRLIALLNQEDHAADADRYLSMLKEKTFNHERFATLEIQVQDRLGERQKALAIATASAEQHADDPLAQVWLGQMLCNSGRLAEAEKAFRRAVELTPSDPNIVRPLLSFFIDSRRIDEARGVMDRLAKVRAEDDLPSQILLARAEEMLGDRAAARVQYDKAIKIAPDTPQPLMMLAEFLIRSGKTSEINDGEKLLRGMLRQWPGYNPARQTLANLLVTYGGESHWREAHDLLKGAGSEGGFGKVNRRLQALLLLRRGGRANRQQALEILQELVLNSGSADGTDRLLLAKMYDDDGDIERAQTQYALLAAQENPAAVHLAATVDFMLRHGSAEEAEKQISRLEKLAPDDLTTISSRVRFWHNRHLDEKIPALLEAAAERSLDLATNPRQQGQVCRTIGGLYETVEDTVAAERWYRKLIEYQADAIEPLVELMASSHRESDAANLCISRGQANPHQTVPAILICRLRAEGKMTEEVFASAEPFLRTSLEENLEDMNLRMMLANARMIQNRVEEARELYRQVVEAEPRNMPALNNLASILAEQPETQDEALKYLERAIDRVGPQTWLLDTKGWVLVQQGKVEQALPMLKDAASSPNSDPRFQLHLATAYHQSGQADQARSTFATAQKSNLAGQLLTPNERHAMEELLTHYPPRP